MKSIGKIYTPVTLGLVISKSICPFLIPVGSIHLNFLWTFELSYIFIIFTFHFLLSLSLACMETEAGFIHVDSTHVTLWGAEFNQMHKV